MPLTLGNNIRVDISLCAGARSSCRSSASLSAGAPHDSSRTSSSSTVLVSDTAKNESENSQSQSERQDNKMMTTASTTPSRSLLLEPPQWAVPAKNESRLEPVGDAIGSHPVVDLTQSSFLRVGRSPSSDLQLLHCSSSRRHALLFHHPNGSCYVVDCGSVHGTFVNGVRLSSSCNNNNSNNARIIPTRVRRGALIRFGGEGAPSFVLKTKMIGFSHLIPDMTADDVSDQPTLSPKPNSKSNYNNHGCVVIGGGILKKRSFEESSSDDDESMMHDDDEGPPSKRRCESPDIVSSPPSLPLRLISPEFASTTKRVTFADDQAQALRHTITYSTEEEESASEDEGNSRLSSSVVD